MNTTYRRMTTTRMLGSWSEQPTTISCCALLPLPGMDLSSPAHALYQVAKSGDPDLYACIFEPDDPDSDPADESLWPQSNPLLLETGNRRAATHLNALRSALKMLPESMFKRFHMGLWTSSEQTWIPFGAWDECKSETQSGKPDPGTKCYLGFDGSFSGDSTALIGVTDTGYVWVEGLWENPGRPNYRVPRQAVDDAVTMAFAKYSVQALALDPPYWERELEEWSNRFGSKKVIEFPTSSRARIAPACYNFYARVMEKTISHDR